jgi:hypothetical protein
MKPLRKTIQNSAVTLAAAAVIGAGWAMHRPAASDGTLQFEPGHLRVLDLVEGEQRRVTFRAVNPTTRAVEVRVTTSCSCSAPQRESITIPAAGEVEVPIVIDTRISPGNNTARIQLYAKGGGMLAESMLTFASTPEVVVEPGFLDVRNATGEVTAEVMSVSPQPLQDVAAQCDDPAVAVRITRVNDYRWQIAVSRTEAQRDHWEATEIVLTESASGRMLRRVPVHCSNLPEARVRAAHTPQVESDGTRRLWILIESTLGDAPEISGVECGGQPIAVHSEPAGKSANWVQVAYGPAQAGQRATMHYGAAAAHRSLALDLP